MVWGSLVNLVVCCVQERDYYFSSHAYPSALHDMLNPFCLRTDNLWVRHMARSGLSEHLSHPHPAAPRCISCTSASPPGAASEGKAALEDGSLAYTPPRVCGACSVKAACKPLLKANLECVMPSAHGGAVSWPEKIYFFMNVAKGKSESMSILAGPKGSRS